MAGCPGNAGEMVEESKKKKTGWWKSLKSMRRTSTNLDKAQLDEQAGSRDEGSIGSYTMPAPLESMTLTFQTVHDDLLGPL